MTSVHVKNNGDWIGNCIGIIRFCSRLSLHVFYRRPPPALLCEDEDKQCMWFVVPCVLFIFFFQGQKLQRQQPWLDLVVWERERVRQDPNSCCRSLFMQPPSAFGHSEGSDCSRKTWFPQQSPDLRVNVGVRLGIGEASKALGGAEAPGTEMIRFIPPSSRLSSWKCPLPPQMNHSQNLWGNVLVSERWGKRERLLRRLVIYFSARVPFFPT